MAVIPAFNEASHLGGVVEAARTHAHQVVVVDDASDDNTSQVAAEAGARVCRHLINLGPGAATATGLACALKLGAEVIVTLDADGQHCATEIPKLLAPIEEDRADLVIGSRLLEPQGMPRSRRLANHTANLITRWLYGVAVSDSQSGFKALTGNVAKALELRPGFEFSSDMLGRANRLGFRLCEVEVRAIYTPYSMSKGQGFGTGLRTLSRMLVQDRQS